ncbi:LCP family protein [Streptomyces sp. NPDC005876]|uniref:LCP family protein n=1 Tax=Streptomyces sp. NPDC005876 TaxID=3157076 RepID=UPI00340A171B
MNDQYDAGYGSGQDGPYGAGQGSGHDGRYDAGYGSGPDGPYELVGYDEYGRPVYGRPPAQPAVPQQPYDPYAQQQYRQQQQQHQQGYGYDPYAQQQPYDPYGTPDTGQQPPVPAQDAYGYDPYAQAVPEPAVHDDPYGRAGAAAQPAVAEQTARIPQQAGPPEEPREAAEPDYRTEQFAFVEEPDGDSEDVIDWMKFTENRTERREEARRRARARAVALGVVLALVAVGGIGYLWYAGKLPGLSSSDSATGGTAAAGAQKRDVIAVHLHDTDGGETSTALLVDNTTTERGTTVLVPNALALTGDDGSATTLAKSVDAGPDATQAALDSALGTDIEGTWRLDTPYLQNLVDLVGNIDVDTDADVPDPGAKGKDPATLVHRGEDQTLSGKMAVAYATHQGPGEAQDAQLKRFGQVMQAVLRKLSSDPGAATTTVQTLGMILDPPLTDKDLGAFLAGLADRAKGGDYTTTLLPVQDDGTLSAETADNVVKDVLGGTAKSPDEDAAVSVSVRNATGDKGDTAKARVVLLNGGFTFLEGGTASATEATSEVRYADAADKEQATEVAKTLGLPAGAVAKGEVPANARVSVVLGQDYRPSS